MWETPDELTALQDLIDASFARASEHLVSIMEEPRRLPALRLVAELPSPAVLNIATVTARGEPRVSAVDGHFLHGHWYFTTSAQSPKARQLAARPAISDADWLVGFAMTPDEQDAMRRAEAEREARRAARAPR